MGPRFSLPGHRLAKLLAVPVAIGVFWAFFSLGASCQREDRVTRLLREFARDPNQKLADRLVDLLDREQVSPAQGEAILRGLLTPQVVVRDTYPLGQPAYITATTPVDVAFRKLSLQSRGRIEGLGQVGGSHGSQRGMWIGGPRIYSGYPPDPSARGAKPASTRQTCRAYLVCRFALVRPREVNGVWTEKDPPTYMCDLTAEVELRWVAAAEAEQIARRSNPELDKAMAAALTLDACTIDRNGVGYRDPVSGAPDSVFLQKLVFPALPENIGFCTAFRPASGAEIPFPSFEARHRKGAPGFLWIPLDRLNLPAGIYQGTLVLRPDESIAYPDCAIKTIWGGTVELPITFTVKKEAGK